MMFDEELIKEIKRHTCIYDRRCRVFRKRAARRNAWAEISETLNASVEDCQSRWKSLRDRYVKETNKLRQSVGSETNETVRKWMYFDTLSFLKDAIQTSSTTTFMKNDIDETTKHDAYAEESYDSFIDRGVTSTAAQRIDLVCEEDENSNDENPLEISPKPTRKRKLIEQLSPRDDFNNIMGKISKIMEKKLEVEKVEQNPYLAVIGRLVKKVDVDRQDDLYIETINYVNEKVKELLDDDI